MMSNGTFINEEGNEIMNNPVSKGRPVLFSIMLGVALTLLVSIGAAVATIMSLDDKGIMIAQGIAFLMMAIIITVYMRRKDHTLGIYGFKKVTNREGKASLYYIPLIMIVLVQPLMGGINMELSLLQICIIIVFSLIVGYTEETIFRGIIRERLQSKGSTYYIVFSSILFGILHMANAFNGTEIIHIILQVMNAFLIGIILALLIELTSNIIPLIIFHFMFDALAQVTNPAIEEKELLVVSILNILYLLYGIYLVVALGRKNKRIKPEVTL